MNNDGCMKVFTIYMGWRGGIVIRAKSKEEAFDIACEYLKAENFPEYCPKTPEEMDEMTDVVFRFHGDD